MADIDPRWHAAAAEALSAWGMSQASIQLASHSENLVYRIEADGRTYGLRVHRPGYHTRQEPQRLPTQLIKVVKGILFEI